MMTVTVNANDLSKCSYDATLIPAILSVTNGLSALIAYNPEIGHFRCNPPMQYRAPVALCGIGIDKATLRKGFWGETLPRSEANHAK